MNRIHLLFSSSGSILFNGTADDGLGHLYNIFYLKVGDWSFETLAQLFAFLFLLYFLHVRGTHAI